jgi:hypothetical protein
MKFRVRDCYRSNGTVWKQVLFVSGIPWAQNQSELYSWCTEQFGPFEPAVLPEDRRWSISLDRQSTYYFRNATDCEWFLLRWS